MKGKIRLLNIWSIQFGCLFSVYKYLPAFLVQNQMKQIYLHRSPADIKVSEDTLECLRCKCMIFISLMIRILDRINPISVFIRPSYNLSGSHIAREELILTFDFPPFITRFDLRTISKAIKWEAKWVRYCAHLHQLNVLLDKAQRLHRFFVNQKEAKREARSISDKRICMQINCVSSRHTLAESKHAVW